MSLTFDNVGLSQVAPLPREGVQGELFPEVLDHEQPHPFPTGHAGQQRGGGSGEDEVREQGRGARGEGGGSSSHNGASVNMVRATALGSFAEPVSIKQTAFGK